MTATRAALLAALGGLLGVAVVARSKPKPGFPCARCGKPMPPDSFKMTRAWARGRQYCICRIPPDRVKLTTDEQLAVEVLLFEVENEPHGWCGEDDCRICYH